MIDLFHSTLKWKKKQPTCSIWMSKHTMDRLPGAAIGYGGEFDQPL
jgi:hypothetical protein